MTQRRSNSLMLPNPDDDDEVYDIVPVPDAPSLLAQAAAAADFIARSRVFEEYHAKISANTRRRQLAGLALFAAYLADAGVPDVSADTLMAGPEAWREVKYGLVKGFQRWMIREGYAIGSINGRLSTVRKYCGLAREAGVLDEGEYTRISLISGYAKKEARNLDEQRDKTRTGHKRAGWVSLSKEQARALKDQPNTPQGRRDALLLCLLLDHGLRCGEVAELEVRHFNLRDGTFTFYRRKVDKWQTHAMTEDTRKAARTYFTRDALPVGPLLRGSRKNGTLSEAAMGTRSITGRVQTLGKELGIQKLSAHDCRHYWATSAAKAGTPTKNLQDAGGWSTAHMALQYQESAKIANEGVKLE
jgi:integrase